VTSGAGRNTITWNYRYYNRRHLRSEEYSWGDPSHYWWFSWDTNAYGDVAALHDPWGRMGYAPNALGQPTEVSGYASGITYHPNGAVAGYSLANGQNHSTTQNIRGLPELWQHGSVSRDRYSYDAHGNVTAINDEVQGLHRSMPGYDGLDRLREAHGPWGSSRFDYDALDNLVFSQVGARSLTHRHGATNRLERLEGSLNLTLDYDANGNVINRGGVASHFDIGNRLMSAPGRASYAYDGHGRRNLIWFQDGTYAHQAYTMDGKLRFGWRWGQGGTRHVYLGDKLIAEVRDGGVTTYTHTDALGSPVARTNASGAVISRTRYEPYGATVAGSDSPGWIGFTGHVSDVDTGLVYMQQRYYDPIAGRFLSVDPVTTDAATGGHFNRYVYGNNNPYRYVDPDGRVPVPLILKALDVAVTVAEVAAAGQSGGLGAALKAGGEALVSSAVPGSKVFSAVSRYSRAAYGYRSGSATAKAVRQGAEGAPCPKCGQEMVSGTKTAPQVQHDPPLSVMHYEGGGSNMTAAEKKAYANSETSMNGANCAQCQKQEGGAQRQYVQEKEKLKKPNE
jgi:RHS repeat-associated protein